MAAAPRRVAAGGAGGAAVLVPHHRGIRRQPADDARARHHDQWLSRGLPQAADMSAVRRAPGEGPATPAAAVLVAAAIAVVYAGARHAGFVGDDFMILHRLQSLTGAGDLLRFFRGEFFDYYRPLGFVAHAVDWAAAGADARQFHTTNIVLHAVAATLVLLIGRELS